MDYESAIASLVATMTGYEGNVAWDYADIDNREAAVFSFSFKVDDRRLYAYGFFCFIGSKEYVCLYTAGTMDKAAFDTFVNAVRFQDADTAADPI